MIIDAHQPEVSILIPAYMAAEFIDRTLLFARGQTHSNLVILISIDAGNDRTADIAREHAALDSRISVYEQTSRLGWAGNVNFLLEQVRTAYFFIYFHDDILLPQYTSALLEHMLGHPDAAGAYCAMGHFGAAWHTSRGPAYTGSVTRRFLTLMLARDRGSPLRAMMRTERAGHLRLLDMANGGFWANEPLLLDMLACGPFEHLPQVLYLRWDRRDGGLTAGWRKLPLPTILAGWRSNIDARLKIFARVTDQPSEQNALIFALYLQISPVLRSLRDEHGAHLVPPDEDIHPILANPGIPELLAAYGQEIETLGRQRCAECRE